MVTMRVCLLLFWSLVLFETAAQTADSTQTDIVNIVFGKKKKQAVDKVRDDRKVYFSILPAAVSVPGGGRAVITSINAAFYTGDPANTNLSNVYLIPYTNLADRYGVYLRPNVWLAKNTFNFIGDYRLAHFPQYTWGLGGNTPEWDQSLIDSDYVRIYQNALLQLYKGHWYAGPGYALDYHYNISENYPYENGHLERYGDTTRTATSSSGFTFNIVYDARKNAINPQGGSYFLISWRWNERNLGSTFTNNSLFIDSRKYFSLSKERVSLIALRSYYWTVLNGDTPYLDLPSTNWAPNSGIASRGFEIGRYRSNAMLYGEIEHRYQLSANGLWGFVAFANLSSASEFNTQQFKYWQVGSGVGVRLKLNKYSNANLAMDLAFSKNYWSVWLNIGEMF